MEEITKKVIPNNLFFSWVEDEIAAGNTVRFLVNGYSMMPLLRNGKDEVELEPCDQQSVKEGDIILFRYMGKHILHRAIKCESEGYIFRGDNVFGRKEAAQSCDVIGKVSKVYRMVGLNEYKEMSPMGMTYRARLLVWRSILIFKLAVKRLLGR